MRILEALKLQLRATSGISEIVGNHVYKRRPPQAADYPLILVSLTGVEYPARSNTNRATFTNQLVTAQVQIDCYSLDEDDVETLAQAVAHAIDDMNRTTMQGVKIALIRQINEHDNWEPRDDASDEPLYRITQDYEVTYCESTS